VKSNPVVRKRRKLAGIEPSMPRTFDQKGEEWKVRKEKDTNLEARRSQSAEKERGHRVKGAGGRH